MCAPALAIPSFLRITVVALGPQSGYIFRDVRDPPSSYNV